MSYYYFVGISRFRLSIPFPLGFIANNYMTKKKSGMGREFEAEGPREKLTIAQKVDAPRVESTAAERRLPPARRVYASPLRGPSCGTEQQLAVSPVPRRPGAVAAAGSGTRIQLRSSGAGLARRPRPSPLAAAARGRGPRSGARGRAGLRGRGPLGRRRSPGGCGARAGAGAALSGAMEGEVRLPPGESCREGECLPRARGPGVGLAVRPGGRPRGVTEPGKRGPDPFIHHLFIHSFSQPGNSYLLVPTACQTLWESPSQGDKTRVARTLVRKAGSGA